MATSSEAKLIFCLYRSGALVAYMKESPWRGDAVVQEIMARDATSSLFLSPRTLNVVVGTWNVNEKKPSRESLQRWLRSFRREGAPRGLVANVLWHGPARFLSKGSPRDLLESSLSSGE